MRASAGVGRVLWLSCLFLAIAWRADAQSWLTANRCDAVQIDGHEFYRTSFTVRNLDPTHLIFGVVLYPEFYETNDDTCHAVQVAAPNSWSAAITDGFPRWTSGDPKVYIAANETLDGFEVTLSRTTCCFNVDFLGQFGDKFAGTFNCFFCPLVTPSSRGTWGQLKVLYR
jgi:hypothetical protein